VNLERMVVYRGGGAPLPIDEDTGEWDDGAGNPLYEGKLQYTVFSTPEEVLARRGEVAYIHGVKVSSTWTYTVESATTLPLPSDDASNSYKPILGYFDVHPIIFPTQDSFATVGLQGASKLKWKQENPGQAANIDTNPFGTRGYLSVRFWHASLIIREENLLVAFVAATQS
jgi:hypothetical protein